MLKLKPTQGASRNKRDARLLMPDLPSDSALALKAAAKVASAYPLQMEAARKEHKKVTAAQVALSFASLIVLALMAVMFATGSGETDILSLILAGVSVPLAVAIALPAVLTSRKGVLAFLREEAYRETFTGSKRNSSKRNRGRTV